MYVPMACLPIALWYVLRGDWLWSGKGMMDAQMPRIIDGWISQCVYSVCTPPSMSAIARACTRSSMVIEIIVVSSSSVSTYSMHPVATRSFHVYPVTSFS